MGRIELLLGSLGAVACMIFFFLHAGGPISWDELLYMSLSVTDVPWPKALNRYFHIYLQKVFFWLAGDPLTGAKLFWSFLVSGTLFLVYVNARILVRETSPALGLLAVFIFLSSTVVFGYHSGVVYADFTIMFMMTLLLTVYLCYVHFAYERRHMLIFLFGLLYFLSLKSKESSFLIILLALGFVWDGESRSLEFKSTGKKAGYLLAGVALGAGAMILLDWIFLKDPLFGYRAKHFKELLDLNFSPYIRPSDNWFLGLLRTHLLFFFFLYLLALAGKSEEAYPFKIKIVWLIPLALLSFFTVVMIEGAQHVINRFLIPLVPFLSITGAHFFNDGAFLKTGKKPIFWVLASITVITFVHPYVKPLLLHTFQVYGYAEKEWTNDLSFYIAITHFLGVALFFAATIVLRRDWTRYGVVMTALFVLASFGLFRQNMMELITGTALPHVYERRRFFPLRAFSQHIDFDKTKKFYVSKEFFDQSWMLCNAPISCMIIFTPFYNREAVAKQFVAFSKIEDLSKRDYDYAFLSGTELEKLKKENFFEMITSSYGIEEVPFQDAYVRLKVVLLHRLQGSGRPPGGAGAQGEGRQAP